MRIQHNIMAMNAYRNYTNNVAAMKSNLEKLSSGYKINRAGDDAAGLAISEKMRAQITGLQTAQKNAKDGISLVQTAEGALTEVHDMLNRMVELATQSANGTYDNDTDRYQLQKEVDQLRSEINRIADSSNFNGIKLLDGSMDTDGGVAATTNNFIIPAEGLNMQKDTLLNRNGDGGKPEFGLELHNAAYNLKEGEKFKFTIGEQEYETDITTADLANADADGYVSGADLGDIIVRAFTKGGTSGKVGETEFTATVSGSGNNAKVTFKAGEASELPTDLHITIKTEAPADGYKPEVASATVAKSTIGVSVGSDGTAIAIAAAGGANVAAAATNALDNDAISAFLADKNISATTAISIATSGANYVLKAGNTVIGTAAKLTSAVGTTGTAIAFATEGGTSLGSVTVKATAGQTVTASEAAKITLTLSHMQAAPITAAVATAADSDAKAAIASAAGSNVGKVTIAASTGGTDLVLKVGNTELTGVNFTVTANKVSASVGGETIEIALENNTDKASLIDALGAKGTLDTGIEVKAGTGSKLKGSFNEFTTENKSGEASVKGQLASTTFKIDTSVVKEGSYIQIGNFKYNIEAGKAGQTSSFTESGNEVTLTIDKDILDKGGDALVDTVGELMSRHTGNTDFTIGYDRSTNKISVHERDMGDGEHDFSKIEGGNLSSVSGFQKLLGYGTAAQGGKGLTLQIGDTADSFNKLTVNIKDMHAASLGLDKIDISDQDSAADAIEAIKKAINTVSDVRGTLGATQNRLDHTINNLSVMTENIQDAESTIRDVDVAEEMMAYTKNNILIQSAQAMLAQANQVPQGVLQLLQ